MSKKEDRYIETVGRRKTAIARVRLTESKKPSHTVNNKPLGDYFQTSELQGYVKQPIATAHLPTGFSMSARVKGGGICAQAVAISHGVARALVEIDQSLRRALKKEGYLKRDPRMKERRKFGLKKARRAPQWSKR